jgi:multisubunit Na+/H+ antiporter MnhC subunit
LTAIIVGLALVFFVIGLRGTIRTSRQDRTG